MHWDWFHCISQNKVFNGLATRGKTSVDWFFGFKLHPVVNELGELLNIQLTPCNIDDRKPVKELVSHLFGKIFKVKKNMKNKLMLLQDKLLARRRSIIETIIEQLKNISQTEHSRHRSPVNFCVNLICGLIAYCHQPKKPSINL